MSFGPETLVYRVKGKIFALTGLDNVEFKVNLKCDPEYAMELRDQYDEIQAGYHMNKNIGIRFSLIPGFQINCLKN